MYVQINAFWFGVLATIGTELVLIIAAAVIYGGKKK